MAIKISKKSKDNKKQIEVLKPIIEDLVNKQSVEIIEILAGKKHLNEFVIAKKLKLTVNQIRNTLYKLSDLGLVSFTRKKDKRKGWYIYFWTLNQDHAINLLEENLKKRLGVLEAQLKNREENNYYFCNICTTEVNEETALLNNFTCSECGTVYELVDNKEVLDDINKKILKIKRDIEILYQEKRKEKSPIKKENKIKKLIKKIKTVKRKKIKTVKRKKIKKIKK